MKSYILAFVISSFLSSSNLYGQPDTIWQKWNWLSGDWVGEGSGKPGQGTGEFSFRPDLDGNIFVRRNHSVYPATKDKPELIHDDLMIIYLDNAREPTRAIYFDNENHTIDYAISYPEKSIVFTSNKLPAMPMFRLTYVPLENDTISVTFEISQDGQSFQTYTEGRCVRKKQSSD